jgi:uroporphyrin-III C-methyltransferase/precorrin-2 dehydrogenase/sirohydrochlorin ferrochelatase
VSDLRTCIDSKGSEPQLYPAFLRLAGREVLLVGGGRVAAAKLPALLGAGARVTVVAPEVRSEIEQAPVTLVRRSFEASDLDGKWFVVSAAPGPVNREVASAAEARRVFVNAVDDVAVATAYLGGVVRKGGVTLAISTGGAAPALAGLLREGIDALLPDDLARWEETAAALRKSWKEQSVPMEDRRPKLLQALNRLYSTAGGPAFDAAGEKV